MNVLDEAASHVHQTNIRIRPPKKYPTPYGGRLVWTLPGKTKMIVHLKDKAKIRHRKRWSQVRIRLFFFKYTRLYGLIHNFVFFVDLLTGHVHVLLARAQVDGAAHFS